MACAIPTYEENWKEREVREGKDEDTSKENLAMESRECQEKPNRTESINIIHVYVTQNANKNGEEVYTVGLIGF